jgi:hypothetical protein
MDERRRSSLAIGLLLILVGGYFLVAQFVPGVEAWLDRTFDWPAYVIGLGVLLLLIGVLSGSAGMAVPAMIVAGIGGILYWQNLTEQWETWSYLWTLIPGFVGLGVVVTGLLSSRERDSIGNGLRLVLISLILFAIFASIMGELGGLGAYWPIVLILLGLLMLSRRVFARARM